MDLLAQMVQQRLETEYNTFRHLFFILCENDKKTTPHKNDKKELHSKWTIQKLFNSLLSI